MSDGFLLARPLLVIGGAERMLPSLRRGLADAGERVIEVVLDGEGVHRMREQHRDGGNDRSFSPWPIPTLVASREAD